MSEYEVIFWGDVINCVRDDDGKEYNLQEIIAILQEQQKEIEKLKKIKKFQKDFSGFKNFKPKNQKISKQFWSLQKSENFKKK